MEPPDPLEPNAESRPPDSLLSDSPVSEPADDDVDEWSVEANAADFQHDADASELDREYAQHDADDGLPDDNRDYLTSDRLPRQVRATQNAPDRAAASGLQFGERNAMRPEVKKALGRLPIGPGMTIVSATVVMLVGLAFDSLWLGATGAVVSLVVSIGLLLPSGRQLWVQLIPEPWRAPLVAALGLMASSVGLLMLGSSNQQGNRAIQINWDAVGALGEIVGAIGQIAIAILAVYVAWQQYVISRDLTIQQNRITQQQTIDAYFQGVSDLTLNDEGLLEDWPQERAIAEGRTAAILSSVDAAGKAKIVRFLSQSRLLSPLKRDRRLGRPILDGSGGYLEDRDRGTRVIDLSVMLAAADLADTDLRWSELSDANLVRADLSNCDLVKANLSARFYTGQSFAVRI